MNIFVLISVLNTRNASFNIRMWVDCGSQTLAINFFLLLGSILARVLLQGLLVLYVPSSHFISSYMSDWVIILCVLCEVTLHLLIDKIKGDSAI